MVDDQIWLFLIRQFERERSLRLQELHEESKRREHMQLELQTEISLLKEELARLQTRHEAMEENSFLHQEMSRLHQEVDQWRQQHAALHSQWEEDRRRLHALERRQAERIKISGLAFQARSAAEGG